MEDNLMEGVVVGIKARIETEYKKYGSNDSIDWMEVCARKIASALFEEQKPISQYKNTGNDLSDLAEKAIDKIIAKAVVPLKIQQDPEEYNMMVTHQGIIEDYNKSLVEIYRGWLNEQVELWYRKQAADPEDLYDAAKYGTFLEVISKFQRVFSEQQNENIQVAQDIDVLAEAEEATNNKYNELPAELITHKKLSYHSGYVDGYDRCLRNQAATPTELKTGDESIDELAKSHANDCYGYSSRTAIYDFTAGFKSAIVVAIEFADWIGRNGYRKIADIHGSIKWAKGNGLAELSTEQLYAKFTETKSK